jgi:hypothetical protein
MHIYFIDVDGISRMVFIFLPPRLKGTKKKGKNFVPLSLRGILFFHFPSVSQLLNSYD